ncbi:hypothetical protein BJ322DRAFT_532249 [Thelephora terrestris]|uniref:Uncharacterized protein n=1 Tax=Thelephora terrestris TaxID=56493 RepID=A0A9P6HL43_9AGAM|nr:hypothetical protein BJ322DRAFT_532249 [Thelephora terrestris]
MCAYVPTIITVFCSDASQKSFSVSIPYSTSSPIKLLSRDWSIDTLPSQRRASTRANIGAFSGAVGIVGLLFLLSLGLAIVLYRKQRVARTRLTLPSRDDASLFTESIDDHPRGEAPSSFIPRYFSDAAYPPPPYKQEGRRFHHSWDSDSSTAYAERPPPTQPPPIREEKGLDPNLHKIDVPNMPLPVYIPGYAIHPLV